MHYIKIKKYCKILKGITKKCAFVRGLYSNCTLYEVHTLTDFKDVKSMHVTYKLVYMWTQKCLL